MVINKSIMLSFSAISKKLSFVTHFDFEWTISRPDTTQENE
jgi:hypothetical protein